MSLAGKTNPLLYTSQKLSGEWSAYNFATQLDTPMVHALQDEWQKLDTGVRMRVLLSTLFMSEQRLEEVRGALERLIAYALESGEEDDWVKVIARALRQLDGHLDFAAVEASTKDVAQTVAQLTQQMQELQPYGYYPLETQYLNTRLVPPEALQLAKARGQQLPFTLREGADDAHADVAGQAAEQGAASAQALAAVPAAVPAAQTPSSNNPIRQRSSAAPSAASTAAATAAATAGDMFRSSRPEQRRPMGQGNPACAAASASKRGKQSKVLPLDPKDAPKLVRDRKALPPPPADSTAHPGARALPGEDGHPGAPTHPLDVLPDDVHDRRHGGGTRGGVSTVFTVRDTVGDDKAEGVEGELGVGQHAEGSAAWLRDRRQREVSPARRAPLPDEGNEVEEGELPDPALLGEQYGESPAAKRQRQ